MPLKDKEKRKDAARDRQRKHRQGVTQEGVTWETISLKDIKSALPDDIVADITALGEYDRIRERNITLEGRFRRAYKYKVWHDENFIDGIHRGSKYRELANV